MADKWWDSSSRRNLCLNSVSLTSINLFQDPTTTLATTGGGTGDGGHILAANPTLQMMGLDLSTQPLLQLPDWNQDSFGGDQKNDAIGYQTLIQENQSLSSNTSPFELENNQWKSQKMYSISSQDTPSDFKQINVMGYQNMDSYGNPTKIQSLLSSNYKNNHHQQQQDSGFDQNEEMDYSSYQSGYGGFWNASAAAIDDARSSFFPSLEIQSPSSTFEDHKAKNTEMVKKSCSKSSSTKRHRNENQSPLPAFKVRKEKMGDKITALQQLVSPFGKTDTASVLAEAIEYIKFLHEQVSVLSTPYMKNGTPIMNQQKTSNSSLKRPTQELRSQGLCLVPVSSTYPMTQETNADFWTPNFAATFR